MIKTKKKFGQVFLNDIRYIESIIKSIPDDENQIIIEIGPGAGAITGRLADKAAKLFAVEIDRDLVPLLQEQFKNQERIRIIQGDFMEFNLEEVLKDKHPVTIVGNLPYNVASHILLKLIRHRSIVNSAYIMLQREVGERITAKPDCKDYSFLTVAINTFAKTKRLFLLPPGAFRPAPKVDSAFLQISMEKDGPDISDTDAYFKMLTCAFSQRRKKVVNVLSRHYPEQTVYDFFTKHNIDINSRAENLPIKTYIELYNALYH